MANEPLAWARCNQCKGDIDFEETYYACSVSTCNRKGTEFRFCSVECWDAHVPVMRHRDAGAEERSAPTRAEWERDRPPEASEPDEPEESDEPRAPSAVLSDADLPHDVLVVVSKVKAWVRARSGMNTSDAVVGLLSDHVRRICDQAIRNAAAAGRKTVLDRDVPRSAADPDR